MSGLKFVILHHTFDDLIDRTDHWDLMIERPQTTEEYRLATWALSEKPSHGINVPAQPLPDHRIQYLEYAGPISGGRGKVEQVASGTATWLSSPMDQAVQVQLSFADEMWTVKIENGCATFS